MNTSISTILATINENLGKVQDHLKMIEASPSLERCNSICVFPETGLTICSSEEGKPVITSKLFATQFTPTTAAEICKNVTNGKSEYPINRLQSTFPMDQ